LMLLQLVVLVLPGGCESFASSLSSSTTSATFHHNHNNNHQHPHTCPLTMASRDKHHPDEHEYTTNEEDQRAAQQLQARLRDNRGTHASERRRLPSVQIAEGRHKYVLITAELNGDEQAFVTSRQGAHYHRNAADPLIYELERAGYTDIHIAGGGRLLLDSHAKKMEIFGYSYSFGLADHAKSKRVVLSDPRYKDFDISISNDGY
jgi:phosphohistidine phosphatase